MPDYAQVESDETRTQSPPTQKKNDVDAEIIPSVQAEAATQCSMAWPVAANMVGSSVALPQHHNSYDCL